MRHLICLAVTSLLAFTACQTKQTQEGSVATTAEETANATDIAETTAAPLDTAGLTKDSTATDSIK